MENLAKEIGNTVAFSPINGMQRSSRGEGRLEITVRYNEAQGIFDEARDVVVIAQQGGATQGDRHRQPD